MPRRKLKRKPNRKYKCDHCGAINSSTLQGIATRSFEYSIRLCNICKETLDINRELKIKMDTEYTLYLMGTGDNTEIHVMMKKQEPKELKF